MLFEDTTSFMSIDVDDEILVAGRKFRVTGHAREYRFGLDDPKMWVKWVREVETGVRKIAKLPFLESFITSLGGVKIRCFRSPDKEGQILEYVRGHPHFMQGRAFADVKGNNVRILEVLYGTDFFTYIDNLNMTYQDYFDKYLPGILRKLIKSCEAIQHLHLNGMKHGDIRNDHVIIEGESGNFVWIDFDYDYENTENPFALDIFGLGNVLIYAVGKGFHTLHNIQHNSIKYKDLFERLEKEDFSLLDRWLFVNIRKFYPVIPRDLNDILMHFARGSHLYYEMVGEIIEDLNRCLYSSF